MEGKIKSDSKWEGITIQNMEESKLQLTLLPDLDQQGCILVSNHVLWDILPKIRVLLAIMQMKCHHL